MNDLPDKKRYDVFSASTLCSLALLFLTGIVLQSTVYLNHDVSWVLRTASWMLDGKVFGRDIVDVSPPLIWYVSLPPAVLASFTPLSEPTAFRAFAFLLAAVVLAISWRLVKPFRGEGFRGASAMLIVSFAFAILVRPVGDFGQREHFAVMLGMPYLLLVAGLVRGYTFERWLSITVGILAGLGFALKPYFLFVPIGVEIYRFVTTRRLNGVIRPDSLALGGVIVAYLVSIPIFAPEYLTHLIPLFRSVYGAYERSFSDLLPRLETKQQVGVLAISFVFLLKRRATSYEIVLGLGALAFLASYVVQMKGWSYHGYPFFTLFFVFACLSAALAASNDAASKLRRGLILVVVSIFFILQIPPVLQWYGMSNNRSGPNAYKIGQVARVIERYAAGQTVYAFSTRLYPGFPTILYTSAKWGGRFNSQFVVPALVQRWDSGQPLTPELQEAEVFLRQAIYEDFQTNKPQLVLIDAATERQFIGSIPFDDIAFYSLDPRFAKIWNEYKEVERIGQFRVFIRQHESREDGDSS